MILSQMACMTSYESHLKFTYKENVKDDTICMHQGNFQLASIIGAQIKYRGM